MADYSTTAAPMPKCTYCGCIPHEGTICPRIKEIEYYRDGTVMKVVLRDD